MAPLVWRVACSQGGKKKRAKKDPNAPKNALSAFMYFSNATRDKARRSLSPLFRNHTHTPAAPRAVPPRSHLA